MFSSGAQVARVWLFTTLWAPGWPAPKCAPWCLLRLPTHQAAADAAPVLRGTRCTQSASCSSNLGGSSSACQPEGRARVKQVPGQGCHHGAWQARASCRRRPCNSGSTACIGWRWHPSRISHCTGSTRCELASSGGRAGGRAPPGLRAWVWREGACYPPQALFRGLSSLAVALAGAPA